MKAQESETETGVENDILDRVQLVKDVRRWGDLNTDAILDPLCKIFSVPGVEGLIGYRKERHCSVVYGEPICAAEDKPILAEAFQKYCKEEGLSVVYAIISQEFANLAINRFGSVLIQFGNRLILNPSQNPLNKTGAKAVLVRKKVKHALNEGVEVKEYLSNDIEVEHAIEKIGQEWLNGRNGPQVYISHLNIFGNREGKRWFYARQEGRIVGVLMLNEIQTRNGWLLNNLFVTPEAPSGTSEILIVNTFNVLEQERCTYVAVGPVTVKELEHIIGLGQLSSWFIRHLFKIMNKMFRLYGQTLFWEKLQPENEPTYVLFDQVNVGSIKGLLRAMNIKL